jgi:tetratricopeptide (TPR) repeat protein
MLKNDSGFSVRLLTALLFCLFSLAQASFADEAVLKSENEKLAAELATVKKDRDNILIQAKTFLKDKEELLKKIEELKGVGSQTVVETDSLKKEIEILKSELEKTKAARQKDQELHREEMQRREQTVADLEARANSLAQTMEQYTPVKIEELVSDRNRLDQENKNLAARILDHEKRIAELQTQMKPFELDREELYRMRAENKELQKRIQYVTDLEARQKQLLKENAENREKLEVMKAKFKDAVPGLAKSGRISQKMMRENADMHYNLGTIFLQNKQYKEAIKEYERVLELRPSDSETHYNLGVLYDDFLKDREKALYHYQKYLTINPKAPDAKKVETYILSLELDQKVR